MNGVFSIGERATRRNTTWCVEHVFYRPSPHADYALRDVTLEIPMGAFTAVVGPNGAGKSSLLHLLVGTRTPESGTIHLQQVPIAKWRPSRLARVVGVVAQSETIAFPLTVRDTVAMGRYPHLGAWQRERTEDQRMISAAMELCDVSRFADRDMAALSGGERQRVRIARALAQQPTILALDEPTAALDIVHEMTTFELLRNLSNCGMTVVLITHHINLAARYADNLVVLHQGRVAASGVPHDVLTASLVEQVWQWPMVIESHPGPGRDQGTAQVIPLAKPHAFAHDPVRVSAVETLLNSFQITHA